MAYLRTQSLGEPSATGKSTVTPGPERSRVYVDLDNAIVKLDPDRLSACMDRATTLPRPRGLQAAHDSIVTALEVTVASAVEAGSAHRSVNTLEL